MPSPVQRLKEMDINIIEDTSGKGKDFSKIKQEDVVILPAFGASVQEMQMLNDRGVQIVDTTCPWVAKVGCKSLYPANACSPEQAFGTTSAAWPGVRCHSQFASAALEAAMHCCHRCGTRWTTRRGGSTPASSTASTATRRRSPRRPSQAGSYTGGSGCVCMRLAVLLDPLVMGFHACHWAVCWLCG